MKNVFENFENFILKINLSKYRKKYQKTKTVEMDMPKNVQILSIFYEEYWNKKNFISFEKFFKMYLTKKEKELNDFKKNKCYFIIDKYFWDGLEARVYRTWVSLITQLHLLFLLTTFDNIEQVEASEELDQLGKDAQITIFGKKYGLQLKKETKRMDNGIRAKVKTSRIQKINIQYYVPVENDILNPYYLKNTKNKFKGDLKPQMEAFIKYNAKGILKILNNNFIVFTNNVIDYIMEAINE